MRLRTRQGVSVRGWRRRVLAVAAGALGALALPPYGALPALVVALVAAVALLDGVPTASRAAGLRMAALDGWCWGFGYLVAGLWWLGAAFLVEADQFAWAMPLGVVGLPAVLAFFFAAGFCVAHLIWSPGPARILALAVGLTVSEWLRGHVFTGFPWNVLGMALGDHLWLMQAAAAVGLYGLTFLTVLVCAAPATLLYGRRRFGAPLAAGALLIALAAGGALRIPAAPTPIVEGVRLRLMQPNLPQDAKFRPENAGAIMARYLADSRRPGQPGGGEPRYTHLIWPESAFPFLLDRTPAALAQIADLLEPGGVLVTGAARMEEPLPGESVGRFFNAIQTVDADGEVGASYDKVHLVPFGEYLPAPFESAIRLLGLRQFVHVPGGFSAAERPATFAVPGLPPVAATICYEAIFPGAVVAAAEPRPSLILNVTNDGWFGLTPGPPQHFAQTRLRTVEEGLPLVRAANTGISAVVDPYGRIVASLPLGSEGVLDAPLPKAIAVSVFSRLGSLPAAGMVLVSFVLCLVARERPRRGSRGPKMIGAIVRLPESRA